MQLFSGHFLLTLKCTFFPKNSILGGLWVIELRTGSPSTLPRHPPAAAGYTVGCSGLGESKCMMCGVSHQVHRAPRAVNQFPSLARERPWEFRERNTEASSARPTGRGRGSYRFNPP